MDKIITFPHIGSYYMPISYFLKKATNCKVLVPPPITKKTIKLGSINSPDSLCVPFKYNLGNYIEALNEGANIILQAGGGCRYGYYAELQEQILKDMGYDFEFINFISNNKVSIKNIYKFSKKLNKKLNKITFLYYLLNTIIIIFVIDKIEDYVRKNKSYEINKGDFNKLKNEMFKELDSNKLTPMFIIKLYKKYLHKLKKIEKIKTDSPIKIGIVGELYSIMEPYCNCNIEEKLSDLGLEVYRFTTLTYLLFIKKYKVKYYLKKAKKYVKYFLGADATESVALTEILAKKGFDGIIHLKSFGCTPELNAIPILERISNDYSIPIIYFSFGEEDSEVAINTRIEAFYDMLKQKKIKNFK